MERSRRREVQLYSDNLTDFCKDNQLYLDLLKDHVDELETMKQHEAALKQSQTDGEIHRLAKSSDPRNLAVMFTQTDPNGDGRLFTAPARTGEYEDSRATHRYEENPFCYLCSTIEQHKKHMMKTEKKIHGKKRIPYEAPAPFVPPKPPPAKPESKECLYRVTVKTGTDIRAACSVPVYITLRGEEDTLSRTRLTKKFGSLTFFFDSGSTEVFHIRGPRIGRLSDMTLAMETPEEPRSTANSATSRLLSTKSEEKPKKPRHRWLIESVSIRDYGLGMEYQFNIDDWLKTGRRDQVRLKPTTSAKSVAHSGRGILVTTYTGRKATSGTDCRIYISLLGASGSRGRHELRRPVNEGGNDGRGIFQPGSKDVFELYVEDFGDLKGIRLELDTQKVRSSYKKSKLDRERPSESSQTWFVDQVIVKDIKTGQKWLFTASEWLNEEAPMKEYWTVKDVHDGMATVYYQSTLYQIVTKTGTKGFAGTDSTIYLSLFDKDGRRCDIELRDEDKSKFEKGQTDTMTETARVIGTPVKLKVSISGKGVAPDWYMDGIVVTKYLVMEEILQYLQRLQFSNKMPGGLAQEKGKILFEAAEAREKQRKSQKLEERKGAKKDKKRNKDKNKDSSSSKDHVDGSVGLFGRSRRRSSVKSSEQASSDEDEDHSDKSDSSNSDSNDSVKSHDDFNPERGAVSLPYAIQVSFAPRTKEQAWLKKDKTVELQASDAGKMLYRQLRLCSDNENFERIRQELLEKQRAEEEKKKKQQEKKRKKLQEQQEQRRAAARKSGSQSKSSRGRRASTDSSSSSSSSDAGKNKKRRPLSKSATASARKTPMGRSSRLTSDSESSVDAFGKPKLSKKVAESYKKSLSGEKKRTGAGFDAKQSPRAAEDLKLSLRDFSSERTRSDLDRGSARSQLDRDRGLRAAEKKSTPEKKISGGPAARQSAKTTDEFDRSRDKSPLDMGRGQSRHDASKDRGRQELQKDQKRSPRDPEKGRGRQDFDSGRSPRSPRNLSGNQDRFDPDKDRQYRSRLDWDKDLDAGRSGRLDRDPDRSELSRGRGRFDSDKGQDRSDLSRGQSGLDLDRGLDRSDLRRGRSGLDLDRGLDRSDLRNGRSGLDMDRGLDRSDLSRGRSGLDMDRGLDRSDLSRGRSGLDVDRDRNRLDFDSRRDRRGGGVAPAAAPDKPRILVTASDGRQGEPVVAKTGTGRVRQRSFELN